MLGSSSTTSSFASTGRPFCPGRPSRSFTSAPLPLPKSLHGRCTAWEQAVNELGRAGIERSVCAASRQPASSHCLERAAWVPQADDATIAGSPEDSEPMCLGRMGQPQAGETRAGSRLYVSRTLCAPRGRTCGGDNSYVLLPTRKEAVMAVRRTLLTLSAAGASAVGLLAGGFAAASPAGAATPAPTQAGCPTGQLPASILGNPQVKPGQTGGAYIGHGAGAELGEDRLRACRHPRRPRCLRLHRKDHGQRTDHVHAGARRAPRHHPALARPQDPDVPVRQLRRARRRRLPRRLREDRHVQPAANGHQLPTSTRVFLGAHRVHPTSDPFTVERQ